MQQLDSHHDVVVIGAGQAGLATGHHLARQGLDFLILDGAARIGDTWRSRWDSLRLFTPAQYDGLPGMPFPADTDTYPGKDQVAAYLETYAAAFDLPVRLDTRVAALTRDGERYRIDTTQGTLSATQVVVATGPFQTPVIHRSPQASTRASRSCTAPTTATPTSFPTDACSWSAAATPAARSPKHLPQPARSIWPVASAWPCSRSGWPDVTCSGG